MTEKEKQFNLGQMEAEMYKCIADVLKLGSGLKFRMTATCICPRSLLFTDSGRKRRLDENKEKRIPYGVLANPALSGVPGKQSYKVQNEN